MPTALQRITIASFHPLPPDLRMPPHSQHRLYHPLDLIAKFKERIPDGVIPTPLAHYCADMGSPHPEDEAIGICANILQVTADNLESVRMRVLAQVAFIVRSPTDHLTKEDGITEAMHQCETCTRPHCGYFNCTRTVDPLLVKYQSNIPRYLPNHQHDITLHQLERKLKLIGLTWKEQNLPLEDTRITLTYTEQPNDRIEKRTPYMSATFVQSQQ